MTSPRQKKKKHFLKQLQEARRSQEEVVVEVTAAVETIVEQAETPKIAVVSSLKTETVSKKVKPVKTIEQKSEEVKTDLSE